LGQCATDARKINEIGDFINDFSACLIHALFLSRLLLL
jgi:hypothetical protein